MIVGSNVDDVRARIMELESADVYDHQAWFQVLVALNGRPSAQADAVRRMETAKCNQSAVVETVILPLMRDGYEWCGKDHSTFDLFDCGHCGDDGVPDFDCSECGGSGVRDDVCCEYHGVLALEMADA